jgi:3'-phosphoadenosine 5'-phosphosulfate sulfotransferase (PAPS reductase)/FAD synthetase
MKKVLLLLIIFTLSCTFGWAQVGVGQQFPNYNFESWTTETWKVLWVTHTEDVPTGWHSINDATGSLASSARDEIFVAKESGSPAGGQCVRLKSKSVLGVNANGGLSTGRFNAGSMSATAPSNCTYTSTNSNYQCAMTAYPDSVYVYIKTSSSSNNARFNLVIHNNTQASNNAIYQDPAPNNSDQGVVNTEEAVNEAKVVAKATWNGKTNGNWQLIKQKFDYNSYVYNNTTPAYILATFSTAQTAGGGSAGDELYFDDIVLIYNTRLATLTVGGNPLNGFNPNTTTYNYSTPICAGAAFPTVAGTCQSSHATTAITHTPTDAEPYTIIRVRHQNQESTVYKDYRINFTITNAPNAPTVSAPDPDCSPVAHPVTLTASSTGATSYRWYTTATGGTGTEVTTTTYNAQGVLGSVTYYVSAVNSAGCESARTPVTATVNPEPVAPTTGNTIAVCKGSTGTFTATPPSGDNITCRWYATNSSSTVLGTGTSLEVANLTSNTTRYASSYNTVTGCESANRVAVTVNVNNLPTVSISPVAPICNGQSATLTASGATSYTWDNEVGAGNDKVVSPATTTTYTVTGTDANGCTNTASVTVTVNQLPTVSIGQVSPICAGQNTTLTASGASSYSWDNGVGAGNDKLVSPATTTTYTVTGTGANGCTNTATVTVSVNQLPTVSISAVAPICNGQSATLTASGATSYTWDNEVGAGNDKVVSPATTTTYTVTGTGANGCTNTASVTVTVNQLPTVSISAVDPICAGQNATLSASGATSYAWDNEVGTGNDKVVSPATTTTYTVTGTDNNNCSNTATITVTVNQLPNISISTVNPICAGQNATLTANGANSYSWNNNLGEGNNKQVSPATTTSYTVTGTGANGCTNTASVTVTVNQLPTVSISEVSPICNGQSTTLTASGATSYTWDNNLGEGDSKQVSPATTTTYTVTGTDDNTCSNTATVTVTVNQLPTVSISEVSPICNGQSATLTASGATSYTWDNEVGEGNGKQVSPATTTSYTVTGTDNNNCSNTASITITVNQLPSVSISAVDPICNGQSATLTASGATSYTWDNNLGEGDSKQVSPATTTTYTVTGTDANTCSNTATVTVTVNQLPNVSISEVSPICNGQSATLTASGATSYSWSGELGSNNPLTVNPTESTSYTVTGTDATTGCSNTATITITVNQLPAAPSASNVELCEAGATTLSVSNPTSGNSYKWYNAATGGEALYTGENYNVTISVSPTTYYVETISAENCTSTQRTAVIATISGNPSAPTIPEVSRCGNGEITIAVENPTQAYTYKWYTAAEGGEAFRTGDSYTLTINQDVTYYVSVSIGSCESERTAAIAHIKAIPAAPELAGDSHCGTGDVILNVSNVLNDVTYTWYNANDEQVSTGNSYTAENLSSTAVYYVTTTADGCTGASASVTATIHNIPELPSVTPGAHCGAGEVSLSATAGQYGNQVQWFAAAEGGEALSIENNFTTPSISITTSYYVASYNTTTQCIGARQEVIATINNIPAAPTAEDVIICGNGVTTLTAVPAEGLNCQWFNANSVEISTGVSGDSKTLTTGNLSNNTIYYVRSIDPVTNCYSDNTTIQVTVAAIPGRPTASNKARCGAGAITLTATPANNANSCRWYNANSELVYEGTSFEIANLEETTTFTCKSYNSETGCESNNTQQVTATINPIPAVPTVDGNNPICGSGSIQLTGTPGANATVCRWINGNDTITNNNFNTSVSMSTDYLVQSYNANTRCASENSTITVVVNALPTAPQTGNDSQCLGTPVTLTASSAEDNIAFRWYASAQDNNVLAEGSEFHPTNLTVGENNFYAEAYNTLTSCISAERTLATATMIDAPAIPNVADTAHCGPAAFTLSIIDPQPNTTYKWYTVDQGGEAAHIGTSFTTGELISTTHYYVSAAVANYDCESGRKDVTVTINAIPANPTVNGNEAICAGQTLTVSASSDAAATNFVWSDGVNESEDETFTTPTLTENANYTVKAYNVNTHCESEVVNFTVTVNPNPSAPEVSPIALCQNETVVLSAAEESGNTCYWYSSADSEESIATGDSYSPANINVGTTTFYVSQRNNETNCEGPRAAVVATIYPIYAVNYPVTACDSLRWNNELFTESGNYERTLHTQLGCDSVVTLQLTINRSKVTNIDTTVCDVFVWNNQSYETSGDYQQSFTTSQNCDSTVNVHLTVKKSTVGEDHIYLCSNELPYNYNNLYEVTSAGTFTIRTDNAAGCDSTITLTVTVNTQPSAAINLTPAARCGEGAVTLTAHAGQNGTTCRWYASENDNEAVYTGTSYTINNLAATTTYYVSSYNEYNGHPCESGRQAITATINTNPVVPTVANQVRCGNGSVEFTATIDENATTCRWYLTANTTNIAATSLNYSPNISVGSTSFFVESFNSNTGCKSSRIEVTAEAFTIPTAPVLTAMSNCGPQQFSINAPANGYYNWYDSNESTSTLDIQNNTTPMVNASRSYFISHAVDYAGISCESGRSELVLTIYPVYEAQDLYDTLCQNETYTQHGLNETFSNAGAFDRVINTVSSTNCDSLVTLHLWVKEIRYHEFEETVCDSYTWNNETFTASQNITRHFTSSIGCDSVVTLHLTVNKSVETEFSATECDKYTWNSETYYESGNYVQHFSTINGCDSMVTLHLTINKSAETQFSEIACDTYQWNNETYTTSGDYVQHFSTSKGCDSTVTLHLTINYSNAATLTDAVCAGTRYNANGFDTTFNVAGSYTLVRHDLNQAGCDSTTTLTLKVNPVYNQHVTLTICETALPYSWNDITYPVGTASGNYEHTYSTHTAAGCDSIINLHLTISNQYVTPLTVDICEGESITFANQTLSQSGIYYDTLQASNYCDSIIVLNLTVHELHTTNLNASICLGETYNEYGFTETPTTDGTFNYQHIVQTAFGCDSTINLTLTVNPVYHFTEYDTVCANELPLAWQGRQLQQEGIHTAEYQTINTCDSTITLYLTVNPVYNQTESATICQSELPYTWRDTVFAEGTASGNYVFSRSTVNGCDSTVTLTLTVNPIYELTESETICQNELPYTWRDTVFAVGTTSGDYVFHRSTVNGCDSTVTLTLTVNPSYTQNENATICQSELPYSWRDTVFAEGTVSSDYVFHRSTVNGCDSIVILTLVVNPIYEQNESETICQNELPYTWRDTVFAEGTTSGDYIFHRSTVNNCDSTVTLHLTVNPTKHTDLYAEICQGDVYEYNNRYYEVQNDYDFTFQTALGCDSTVTLHLTVNPVYSIDTTINICEGVLPYTFADTIFYGNGHKDVYLHTQHGCDSIYHIQLNVTPFITSSQTINICETELPYNFEDSTFNDAGIYEVTISHNDGCNEIITLTLNVNPTYDITFDTTVCDLFVWNGQNYTESGVLTHTYTLPTTCDSTVTVNLTVNHSKDSLLTPVICQGENYTENGFNLSPENAGIVYDTLHLQCVGTGCDSTVYLALTVNPSYNQTFDTTVCGQFVWNETSYTESAVISHSYTLATGCDSTVTYSLTVNPVYDITLDTTVCDQFVWNNEVYTESGIYTQHFSTVNLCDSTITYHLTVNYAQDTLITAAICQGGSYEENGFNLQGDHAGMMYDTLHLQCVGTGCDSTVYLELTVNPSYNQSFDTIVCDHLVWNNETYTENGVLTHTYTLATGCDSTVTYNLTVNPTYNITIDTTVCDQFVWNGETYTESTSLTHTYTLPTTCDSTVNINLTVNHSVTENLTLTVCQSELPYTWRDITFDAETSVGTHQFSYELETAHHCDSIVNLTLIVNPNNEYYDNPVSFCEGGSYTWNNQTITESGLYTDTVDNEFGCYDVYKLEVTVNPVYSFTEYDTVCDNELPIVWQGRTVSQAGTITADYHTASGCDSIYYLVLTVTPTYYEEVTATVCDNEEYVWEGHEYIQIGQRVADTYTIWDSLSTTYGCDSVYKLTLTVTPTYNFEPVTATVCDNEEYVWPGHEYIQIGQRAADTYTIYDSLSTAIYGCDSVHTLILTVTPTYNFEPVAATVCDNEEYVWEGHEYIQIGQRAADTYTIYDSLSTAVYGCDSVHTLILTVTPTYSFEPETATVCDNEEYVWEGHEYIQIGQRAADTYTIYDSLSTAVYGCDSVHTLILTVTPTYNFEAETATVCDNEEYVWAGHEYIQIGQRAAGTHTIYDSLSTATYGCDSVHTLILTVTPTYNFEPVTATVCDNEEYVWPGHEYIQIGQRAAGTHTIYDSLSTATYGCDSVHTLILTVTPTYNFQPETATVCDNEEYVWEGHEYIQIGQRAADTYTIYDSLSTAVYGCDSVHTLILTVTPTYNFEPETATVCDNEEYVWEGHEYIQIGQRAAGTHTIYDSLSTAVYGCDSVHTLILTVTPTYNFEPVTATVCDNEEYVWPGHEYIQIGQRAAGTHIIYDSLSTAVYGCDSVHTLILTVTPTYSFEPVTATVCDNEEYVWPGHEYIQIGQRAADTYTIYDSLSTAVYGCDSVHTLILTVTPTYNFEPVTATVCDNEEYVWPGHEYIQIGQRAAGTHTIYDSLNTAVYGCDSVHTLILTVTPTYNFEPVTATVCDNEEYVWPGHEYIQIGQRAAGTHTIYDSLSTAVYGCDSVHTLILTVNPTKHSIENASACSNEDVYSWHGRDITATGVYYDTLETTLGCDSVCELRFTLLEPTAAIFADTTCANALYEGYGFEVTPTLSGDTTLIRITENAAGCDSTITVNLYVKPLATFSFDTIVCGAFRWNNRWYTETGEYQQSFTAANGCDSIVTLNLIIDTPSRDTIEVVACESYEWDGTTYTQSGVFSKVYPQAVGCDSIAVMILTINHITEVTLYDTTCQAHRYQEYGFDTLLMQFGTFTLQRIDENQAGCDSIINLILTVHRGYLFVDSTSTCDNEDFVWHGIHCDTTGIYYKNYETMYGCDSVYILYLKVNPSYEVDVTDTAIAGTLYHNHGLNFTPQNPGVLNIDVPRTTVDGCDSTIHITLVVIDGNSIDMHYLDKHITLYPNPTDNVFTVSSTIDIIRELTIYDNNGKAVMRQRIDDYSGQVNVENLTPGIYFVRMMTPDNVVTKKLIVR